MASIPEELKYTKTHEWVREDDGSCLVGLTEFAQDALGDLVFINLPEPGDEVAVGDAFCDVESVKAVSDVYSPVAGTVTEVNEELLDSPELVNEDPYGAWLVKVEDITATDDLLDAAAYAEVCANEED